jgi:hypothetical protein
MARSSTVTISTPLRVSREAKVCPNMCHDHPEAASLSGRLCGRCVFFTPKHGS